MLSVDNELLCCNHKAACIPYDLSFCQLLNVRSAIKQAAHARAVLLLLLGQALLMRVQEV